MKKKFIFLIAALMLLTMINLPKLVMGQASVGTTMWAETWTGATTATSGSNSATPSANYGKGTTVYNSGTVTYSQSANSVYVRNENTGGGTAPELLLSGNQTWTISNIPTGNATELTLTYKSNNTRSSVTCSTDGATISGSSKSYTITPNGAATITLVFGCSGNTRIDNVSLTVKTAGSSDEATRVVIDDSSVLNNIYGSNTGGGSFSATVLDSSDEEIDGAAVSWSSSNTSVAAINASTGVVTLVAVGNTTITASYAGSSGTYQSSFATYTLTVVNENPAITTIWSEDFSGYSANNQPSGSITNSHTGTTVHGGVTITYNYTNGGGTTQIYSNASTGGGESPELLVAKNNGTFSAIIPLRTSTYGYSGDLTLKYKTNAKSLNVKTTTDGITVDGEASAGAGLTYNTLGEHTVTFKGITTTTENITIVFTTTTSDNVRLDDIVLKGEQAALTKVATPVISPASGAVVSGTKVTITCATDGATIKYSYDNMTWNDYSSALTITENKTVYAKGIKGGLTDSDVATATYTIAMPCATPTFSVATGEVDPGTTVTISTTTDGATIHYTTDGTNPTTSSSTYSSAITINSAMTIKAIAVKAGNANSEVASASYTIKDYATLPFNWTGGALSDFSNLTGTTKSLTDNGSYANSHAPYLIKFTNTDDYLQVKTDGQPAKVTVGVKMIGGATTSKIKVQESANGSDFTNVEEFTISGSSNAILNFATTKSFSATTRYVRLSFEKGSNVGVGPIVIFKTAAIASNTTWTTGEFTPEENNVYVVNDGSTLTLSGDFSSVLTDPEQLIIEDGGILITHNAVEATVQKNITGVGAENWAAESGAAGWYFIASPVDDAPFSAAAVDDYDLYLLDYPSKKWRNIKKDANEALFDNGFQLGTGYLYASKAGNTISVAGEIQPLSNDDNATVILANNGWNLIGNPLTCKVSVDSAFYELYNASAVESRVKGSVINPFQGIAVWGTAGNKVTFTKAASQDAAAPSNTPSIQMTLAQNIVTRGNAASTTVDNAVISFNEGSALPKFNMLASNAKLYIPQDNEEYAIVSSNAQGEMPVNFRAYEAGEYTITVNPEEVEMGYLHLIDNIAGQDIDLLATPSYTFNARTDDYESRFRLVFSSNMANAEMGEDFAFFSNGQLVIANEGEAILQVIDVTGRVVATESINGTCSKAVNAKAGVYVLRLINGTDVKTQKMVIR